MIHGFADTESLLLQTLHSRKAIREVHKSIQHPIQGIEHLIVGLAISRTKIVIRRTIRYVRHAGNDSGGRG